METVLCFLVLLSRFAFVHLPAEAVLSRELNRVLATYNREFDNCREIDEWSGPESRAAANQECDRAFRTLDGLGLNTCSNWRYAECRLVPGDEYQFYQCTCIIPYNDHSSARSGIVTPFRHCATVIREHEERTRQEVAPTSNFQEARNRYYEYLQAAQLRRANVAYGPLESGSSIYVYPSGGATGSQGVLSIGDASTSKRRRTSDYGEPSAACSSYALGETSRGMANPVHGAAAIHGCEECGGQFRSARALFDHKRIHHTDSDMHCYICNKPFDVRKSFLSHLRRKHRDLSKEEVASQRISSVGTEQVMPYSCTVCLKRFSVKKSLRKHMKSHETDDTKCRDCNKIFSTRASLRVHMRNAHPGVPIPKAAPVTRQPKKGAFVCGDCQKAYFTENSLRRHEEAHKYPDTHCLSCNRRFGTKVTCTRHKMKRHPEVLLHESGTGNEQSPEGSVGKCEACGQIFKNHRGLRDHKKLHEGQTKCEECNIVFPRGSALATHKRKGHPK